MLQKTEEPKGLRACPFCAATWLTIRAVASGYAVYCYGCHAQSGVYDTHHRASAAWNTRAPRKED